MGADLIDWYGETIGNRFLDEIGLHGPFDGLTLQCSETVKGSAPTYYRQTAVRKGMPSIRAATRASYSRCGVNGRIEMLLGAIIPDNAARKVFGLDLGRQDRGDSAMRLTAPGTTEFQRIVVIQRSASSSSRFPS